MILLIPRMPLYFALFQSYLNSIMILLIPLLGTSVEELKENLNSIMILLILESLNQYGERKQKFKFHYDSINSIFVSQHLTIMFHLNSIMILLIQMKKRRKNKCQQQFKFHYDSINSRFKMLSIR